MSSCANEPMLSRVWLNSTAAIGARRWGRAKRFAHLMGKAILVMVAALLPRQLICESVGTNHGYSIEQSNCQTVRGATNAQDYPRVSTQWRLGARRAYLRRLKLTSIPCDLEALRFPANHLAR
jgi:hypothetical protein